MCVMISQHIKNSYTTYHYSTQHTKSHYTTYGFIITPNMVNYYYYIFFCVYGVQLCFVCCL